MDGENESWGTGCKDKKADGRKKSNNRWGKFLRQSPLAPARSGGYGTPSKLGTRGKKKPSRNYVRMVGKSCGQRARSNRPKWSRAIS